MGALPEPEMNRIDRLRRMVSEAIARFRGMDETGETDYWGRGGLAGMLGMEPWYNAPPQEIALGFAGAITPAVRAANLSPVAARTMAKWLRAPSNTPERAVTGLVKKGLVAPAASEGALAAATDIKSIQRDRLLGKEGDHLAWAEGLDDPLKRYEAHLAPMRREKTLAKARAEIEASPISAEWTSDRAARVKSYAKFDTGVADAEARLATVEALTREARRLGWEVRHTSKGNDGRVTSRYIKAPDGTEWRISDHRLPYRDDKPNRGWANEIVADDWRTRGLSDYFDEMLRRGAYAEGAP